MIFQSKRKRERQAQLLTTLLDGPPQGMTGYQLCQEMKVGPGFVYPTLARMERQEWVTSYWEDAAEGRPANLRRRFKLTAHGRTRVLAALGRYDA